MPDNKPMLVTIDMEEFVELLVRRLADEQIQPLSNKLAEIDKKVEVIVQANYDRRITKLEENNHAEHQRLHDRISGKRRKRDEEEGTNGEFRERIKGIVIGVSGFGGLLWILVQAYNLLKGIKL